MILIITDILKASVPLNFILLSFIADVRPYSHSLMQAALNTMMSCCRLNTKCEN